MSRERADLGFADALNDLDLSAFAPKPKRAANDRPSKAVTAKAAEAAGFKSREPKPAAEMPAKVPAALPDAPKAGQGGVVAPGTPEAIQQRRRRTGRNVQLNLKARPETIEAYCALADRMGWGLGETLEKAVELLEKHYRAGA
jgi:hypothetical protein